MTDAYIFVLPFCPRKRGTAPNTKKADRVRRSRNEICGKGVFVGAKPAFAISFAKATAIKERFGGHSGERGIRTLDTVSRIHTFQACSFNHSDTSPG